MFHPESWLWRSLILTLPLSGAHRASGFWSLDGDLCAIQLASQHLLPAGGIWLWLTFVQLYHGSCWLVFIYIYILLHLFVIIVFSSLHIRAQVSIIHSCHSPTPDSLTFLNVRYNYMVTSIAFNAWYFLSFELCLLLLCSYLPAYLLAHWILLTVSQCSESVNYFYESFKIIINTSSEIHSMAGKYINKQCVCVWGGTSECLGAPTGLGMPGKNPRGSVLKLMHFP